MHEKEKIVYTIKVPYIKHGNVELELDKIGNLACKKLNADSVNVRYNSETEYIELEVIQPVNLK